MKPEAYRTWTQTDECMAASLRPRLPERIADAHAHLFRLKDISLPASNILHQGPVKHGLREWQDASASTFGEERILTAGLFMPFPSAQGDIGASNAYLAEELSHLPQARGGVLVRPDTPVSAVEEQLLNPQIIGLKPYHLYSNSKPTFEAPLESFVPEWMWKLADERGLVLCVHIVRNRALADEQNHGTIRRMAQRYPRARIILAHAARGFNPWHTVEGIEHIAGIENIWFDMSGICEAGAIVAILRAFGPRRLLWGSDYPVSETHGRCVAVGDSFVWLDETTVKWESLSLECHPTTVGIESARALLDAADQFGLNSEDLRDIFCDNTLRLLGLKGESGTLTQDLYRHAKQRIPGGTQLLMKRPERYAPNQWPAYFREARGCEVWDLDGRHYYDVSSTGIGSCLLGFRDPDVTQAVRRRVNLGAMATLNPPEEVELADLLCELHPWAERVRFARTGGEAVAVAVRIARATTERSLVAICGYHGWHDWYLAGNLGAVGTLDGHLLPGLEPKGVPSELRGTTFVFNYNDVEQFDAIMDAHGDRLAAVVMEPCRNAHPEKGFFEHIRERTRACGALWVIDEISAGFRMALGGAHLNYGVSPDIAVFAKALGNGHPMAAIIGTSDAMAGADYSFISSTYWTESVGPTAALATIHKMMKIDIPAHVAKIGTAVQERWRSFGAKHGLPVHVSRFPCLAHFAFQHEKGEALRTLYTQWMLERGFLAANHIYPCLAHTDEIVARYAESIDEVFGRIAEALARDEVEKRLGGPVAQFGFRRLT